MGESSNAELWTNKARQSLSCGSVCPAAWVRLPTGHNIYTLLFKSFNHITSYLLTYVFLNITHPQSLKIFKWSCLGNIPDYRLPKIAQEWALT